MDVDETSKSNDVYETSNGVAFVALMQMNHDKTESLKSLTLTTLVERRMRGA